MVAKLESVYTGTPKKLNDERGDWVSSIERDRVESSCEVTRTGLLGDRVAQPYHGGADAAICVHLMDHYRFWKERYGFDLEPGGVGENFVLDGITEEEILVGDSIRVGGALLQVSGPRVPCANQARHIGRSDWVKLTIKENRTGFYARVLEPGSVCAGDIWKLERRLNEYGSIQRINRCFYLDFDIDTAQRIMSLSGLGDWWKQQFKEKIKAQNEHWSESMTR